ncbi:hypothetical protein MBLNU230_g2319t1 [Neophaeotheca triangularis]
MSDNLSDFVTIISEDGYSFVLSRSAACISKVIRQMLNPASGFAESKTNIIRLETITGVVLEQVCLYLYYNEKNANSKDVADLELPDELCLELLMAADYLGSKSPPPLNPLCLVKNVWLTKRTV